MNCPKTGKVMHAEIKIGDSIVMLSDAFQEFGCMARSCQAYIYVEDADKMFSQAVKAGAKPVQPMQDMFWGDRCGSLEDPFGQRWSVATHKEDLTPEQCAARAEEFFMAGASR